MKRFLRSKSKFWIASLIVSLGCGLFAQSASAFIDPPVLVPPNPVAGQTVSVSIRHGYCDGFLASPPPTITQVGNDIDILLPTLHFDDPLWCQNLPSVTVVFPVGAFPAGAYTLTVRRFYDNAVPAPVFETLGNLAFTVRGETPTPLPVTGPVGGLLLIAGILAAVAWRRRAFRDSTSASALLLLAALLLPAESSAQEPHVIEVQLSNAQGAPTPDDVVFWVDTSPGGDPPLQAFSVIAPMGVTFLLSHRANDELRAWIEENPDSPRARLERYIIVKYPHDIDVEAALSSLRNDPDVVSAYVSEPVEMSSVGLGGFEVGSDEVELAGGVDYGWSSLNVDAAWFRATGHALVGIVDTGLYTDHPALRQFSTTGQHIGGNFIPAASIDVGRGYPSTDLNVDEQEPEPIPEPACNPGGLPGVPPTNAGHGSHVSGLVAANFNSGLGFKGTCRNCGIAMARIAYGACLAGGVIQTTYSFPSVADGIRWLSDSGVQVINMSLGSATLEPANYCASNPGLAWCEAMADADSRGIVLVGASGNYRIRVQFPSADNRVVAVGGYDSSLTFWDESPGSYVSCPYGSNRECGSNYTYFAGGPRQEVVAGSKAILSSMYPGKNWNPDVQCGDAFGTPLGDGVGLCTGTSMSSPLVAGVVGILRSVNPLVPPSAPVPAINQGPGVRTILANTTFQAQSSVPWDSRFGYGRPDTNAAVQATLGRVGGSIIKNRVTPLFRLYGSTAKDYLDTTSPQFAYSALLAVGSYASQGATIPGYPAFEGIAPPSIPKAGAYVLTTEYKPRPNWPALIPIYMVDRGRYFPKGCPSPAAGCVITGQDFTLLTTKAHIEQARVAGYNLRAIQGYIYQPCTPESTCIPPGAEKFYRACKSADGDCATFLESERVAFEAAGYTTAFPSGSSKILGYAYPPVDSDSDGLVDGFEHVVGTSTSLADSDGDGVCPTPTTGLCDAREFPMIGLPLSDPCDGPTAGSCPAVDIIFKHGFE